MTTYLVHAGTGTIIDASDDVYVITLSEDANPEWFYEDDEIIDLATTQGKRLALNDLTYSNTIAYSPNAIREEVRESLWEYYSDDEQLRPVLEWVETASDEQLNEVASYILQNDEVWQSYSNSLLDGLIEGHKRNKETK